MEKFIDICGNPIELKNIKTFRIVQREYIFRPVYREMIVKGKGLFSREQKQIEFACMQPYAAIKGEKEHSSALDKINPVKLVDAALKDVTEEITTTLGDKLNIKVLKYKKYECINAAGRTFSTYLLDIPAQLVRADGKISEIYKNDELYQILGEPIAPAIEMIPALEVAADQYFLFYGNGVHLHDVLAEYNRLKEAVIEFQNEKELSVNEGKNKNLEVKKRPGLLESIPRLTLPAFVKKTSQEQVEDTKEEPGKDNDKMTL